MIDGPFYCENVRKRVTKENLLSLLQGLGRRDPCKSPYRSMGGVGRAARLVFAS